MIQILSENCSNVEQNQCDATGIGFTRSELTLELAERLKPIAIASGDAKAIYNANKLALCGSQRNIYTGIDMNNSDGECFDGVGHLWACWLGFCQNCEALKARRHRKAIREVYPKLKPPVGTNWNFGTLTSPSVRVPLLDSIKANLRAWDLFRQRKFFVENVWAGWKNVEFTVNKSTGLCHVHIHALMLSKFLRPSEVRATWQDCITKSYRDICGVSLSFGTHGAVIDVRPITKRNHEAIDSAILEVCKYAGKGSAWLSLSDADLLAVSQVEKLPRLFDAFGKSYGKGSLKTDDDIIFNTKSLTAGEKLTTKKAKSIEDLSTLNLKVNVSQSWRKTQLQARNPAAKFKTLNGKSFLPEPQPTEPQRPKLKLIKGSKIK